MRIVFLLLLLTGAAAPQAARAQSDEVFKMTDGDKNKLSIEEYDTVPKGLMLSPEEAAKQNAGAEGEVVTGQVNYGTALKLYKEGRFAEVIAGIQPLANSGHHGAEELLGVMYRMGQGVAKNDTKAVELLSRAAEANRALAQHHLAIAYYMGEGVQQDSVTALMWLHIAILHYPEGPEKKRAQEDRDSVYKTMSRRDKESAMRLTRDWLIQKGEAHLLDLQ